MSLRDDWSKREVVRTEEMDWAASPSSSVWRKRLEQSGPAEAGRVTSVVRYDADSRFPSHPHPDGEEILVLDGVFSDEHGDYPAGTFLLNPEGFTHAPFSRKGCVLFVKLRQYPGRDRKHVHIRSDQAPWSAHPTVPDVSVLTLCAESSHEERIRLVRFEPGASAPRQDFPGGEEIFVVSGGFDDEHGHHPRGTWLRFPDGGGHTPRSDAGCTLYVKKHHLK